MATNWSGEQWWLPDIVSSINSGNKLSKDDFISSLRTYEEQSGQDWDLGGNEDAWYSNYNTAYSGFSRQQQEQGQQQNISQYWDMMQQYIQSQPGYEAYSQYIPWALQNIKQLQQQGLPQYPGQLQIGDPAQEGQILDYLGGQMFDGGIEQAYGGIAEAYKGAFDDFQPAMRAAWEETTQKPAEERLQAMGLAGSTPGMEMMADIGGRYSLQEAAAGRESDIGYARALAGVEEAKQGAFGRGAQMTMGILGTQEARERANIGLGYQDWLTREGWGRAGAGLGLGALGTSAGALSAGAGQGLQFGGQIFDVQNMWDVTRQEQSFMGPLMQQAGQPIDTGGGKGGK